MDKNKTYIKISIGILFGALFPIGIYNLIFKLLERLLFYIDLNILFASGIASFVAAAVAVYIFSRTMNYLLQFDYSKAPQVKRLFFMGVGVNLAIQLIWFIIPIIDGRLGSEYDEKINQAYALLTTDHFLAHITINIGGELIAFLGMVYLIYRKINRLKTHSDLNAS
ncbi:MULTISPECIES: hypothetical protein [unclassified Lentimicrobium]|uniref:hypothetical protein n=1 Tax=unclassified Lentimicrobium TaxID=2677434 RepID=UPI001552139B|nr:MULTISPECIES: hypothetical protein [unclassified Lentimicrobium]NPD44105.1 hypothetical protein [Lentimicrobium sp. S6]NPD86662.1 hypothetical protein [Lentimicrobium sp. L6]